MGTTFLINIDCSMILPKSEITHYTMFIDNSKMSIVYELVEWIRWMFSLKDCIYLIHEKSVIHELEDIQLLAELKNFEIMPCGEHLCVHKKIYRTLLENLNLIVSWNDKKVHKYFLDKINQMSQKLTLESPRAFDHLKNATAQNLITFNSDTESKKKISTEENNLHLSGHQNIEANLRDWPISKKMRITDTCNKSEKHEESSPATVKKAENKNSSLQLDDTFSYSNTSKNLGNESLETITSSSANHKSSLDADHPKSEFTANKGSSKNHFKPKAIKPFSVGEFLLAIRKDLEEKNTEMTTEENTSERNAALAKERNAETKSIPVEDFFSAPNEINAVRKRQRTRKRKRSKKQLPENEFTLYEGENKSFPTFSIATSNFSPKPNHIRFDLNDEEIVKSSEYFGASSENELELNSKEINNMTSELVNNEPKELVSGLRDFSQIATQKPAVCPSEKNDACNMGSDFAPEFEVAGEQKAVNKQVDTFDKISQSPNSLEDFQLNNSNHDLSDLLALRAKYKTGFVIQRF